MKLEWTFKEFKELSVDELYAILNLRNKVFVVEQECAYLDTDDKDQRSFHLCAWENNMLVAYARVIPPGIAFDEASIGRVVTDPASRKKGTGIQLMKTAIEKTLGQFTTSTIRIGAQAYLLAFYTGLGFSSTGKEYLEDGIPHIEMILKK